MYADVFKRLWAWVYARFLMLAIFAMGLSGCVGVRGPLVVVFAMGLSGCVGVRGPLETPPLPMPYRWIPIEPGAGQGGCWVVGAGGRGYLEPADGWEDRVGTWDGSEGQRGP